MNRATLSAALYRSLSTSRICALGVAVWLAAGAPAQAQPRDAGPNLVEQFGDWSVYTGATGGRKVCFALARPSRSDTEPPNRPRDPVYLFVTTRPADGVRAEVSVILGYPHRPNSDATADIGGTTFSLQTQRDNAWLRTAAEDERLVEAMRRGADLVVRGASARGTQTTDRYSLRGVSQALDRMGQECR